MKIFIVRVFLLISLFVLVYQTMDAQLTIEPMRERLVFGGKLGINIANTYDSQTQDFNTDPIYGFAGGAFLAIPLGKLLGVQPEFLFSQRGFKANGNILGSPYELTRTLNYVDIPLNVAVKPSEFITVLAGPQFSFLTKRTDVFTTGSSSILQQEEFSNDNIRKNTVCFSLGADLNMNHFVVSGRAGWDLFKNNGDGSKTTPRYKNQWLQLTVGYRLY